MYGHQRKISLETWCNTSATTYGTLVTNNIDACFVSKTPSHLVCPHGYTIVRKDLVDSGAGGEVVMLGSLRNRTAGRLRRAEWRKNVAQDRECTVPREIFSSFCRPESFNRPVASGLCLVCGDGDWKIIVLHADNIFERTHRIIFKTSNSQYHVACVNPPPDPSFDSTQLLDCVSDFCERMLLNDPNAKMIIAGKSLQLMIWDFMCQHALHQMVKTPTRGQRIL